MILITFVQDQREEAIQRLDRFFKQSGSKMTRERYLEMCDQLGKEPVESEIPPDWLDFPPTIQNALNTFNALGDRYIPDLGFMGKDYTNLPYYMEIYEVTDNEYFLDILSWLDSRAIEDSRKAMKREMDKAKRKH